MRRLILSVLAISLATSGRAQAPETDDQKTLYAIGTVVAKQLEVFNLTPTEFAMVKRGDLTLWLSGPGSSAADSP